MDATDYSFKKISEKNGIITYYTNLTKTKPYTDSSDILNYYTNALKATENKKWIWIFDSDGFDIKQAFEVGTGVNIAKLLTDTYGSNLQEIKIINPTWYIKTMIKAILPFVNQAMRNKVKIMEDRVYSVLEFI